MTATPREGRCARCNQPRTVFDALPEWGRVQSPLCTRDWQLYADARANRTYVDFHDAFDNAGDEEFEAKFAETGP